MPDNDFRITIAIPYYSGANLLGHAIRSVLAQTWSGWKLVVSDDSASGGSIGDLVKSFGDSRIACHRNEHSLGLAGNWNRCLDLASGEYVTILHADDMLMPSYCELMIRTLDARKDAVAAFCRARVVDKDGKSAFSLPDLAKRFVAPGSSGAVTLQAEDGVNALMRGNFIFCPTLCFRRSRLGQRRFEARWRFLPDLELTTRLLMGGESIVGIPDAAYAYRRHAGSSTADLTRSGLRFAEEIEFHDYMAGKCAERGWSRAAKTASAKHVLKHHIMYRLLMAVLSFQYRHARDLARLRRRASART